MFVFVNTNFQVFCSKLLLMFKKHWFSKGFRLFLSAFSLAFIRFSLGSIRFSLVLMWFNN